jgi:NAD(P)H-flavin reductase
MTIMFTARLERIRTLSDSTRDFRFVRDDGEVTQYEPGQFFRFIFSDDEGEFERSYSLCNFDSLHDRYLDLVISKVEGGRATRLLFDEDAKLEGLSVKVTGPFGRLTLPADNPGRLVMVATSVGLAPYLPILKSLEDRGISEVVLLLGVRDRREFLYGDLLQAYAAEHPYFDLRLCLSREPASEPFERNGYVTSELTALNPDAKSDHVLLCGNPAMIDEAWALLKSAGFKAGQVVREKYVFAKEKKTVNREMSEDQKKLLAEKMKKYS